MLIELIRLSAVPSGGGYRSARRDRQNRRLQENDPEGSGAVGYATDAFRPGGSRRIQQTQSQCWLDSCQRCRRRSCKAIALQPPQQQGNALHLASVIIT